MRPLLILASLVFLSSRGIQPSDPNRVIARSVAVNETDWRAETDFDHCERDDDGDTAKTYDITMIEGTPFERLVAVNDTALSEHDRYDELQKLERARTDRHAESPSERASRIAKYQKKRHRLHALFAEVTKAFDFSLDEAPANGGTAYQIDARPRPDYEPPSRDARALTGMTAQFWIDAHTFHWARLIGHVIQPVSIVGLLIRIEPGTTIELEKAPADNRIWLPTHLQIRSDARILLFVPHRTYDDQRYFDYRRSSAHRMSACGVNPSVIDGTAAAFRLHAPRVVAAATAVGRGASARAPAGTTR